MGRRTAPPPISWLMQTALARPQLISLAAGFTDNATLPVEISRRLLNRVLRSAKTGRPALQYGITAGETNLRRLGLPRSICKDSTQWRRRPRRKPGDGAPPPSIRPTA